MEPALAVISIALIYLLTILGSGFVVRGLVLDRLEKLPPPEDNAPARVDPKAGQIIGKCENIIAVTCILANQIAGLAIIFAAKSLVRNSKDSRADDYYLCGTLVNLVWSGMMGFLARWVWRELS